MLAAGILAYTWRHLNENRGDARSPRRERFGPGNVVTLTRGLVLATAGGFLVAPAPEGLVRWLPPILYTAAIVADLFDGVLARRADFSTLLGARLDIELDGLGVLLAVLLAVHLGQLPIWFVPVGLARPLFAVGLWWRKHRGLATHELPPSRHRKLLAGIQMGFLSAALWPVLDRAALVVLGVCALLPFLVGFARDWLIVSGRLHRSDSRYLWFDRHADRLLTQGIPLVLRMLALAAVVWLWLREPLAETSALTWVSMLGLTGILLGAIGRLSAIALILAVAIQAGQDVDLFASSMLAGAAAILVFGTGPCSLWKPEDPHVLASVDRGA
jgi:CDP-diacylglycerol--glycerol-3-phosphate 3-phosphatidyltransferase